MFPPWLAVIEQVPVLRSSTKSAAFLQTVGVFDVKLIGSSELDCAVTANGEPPKIWLGIASNAMI